MKVKIISQKLIKPCTPTPQNLRSYKISYMDELIIPHMNIGLILYYSSKPEKISQLEESLAEILPQFYPLAGRYLKKDRVVDCSDEGAEFILAEAVDIELCGVVEKSTTADQLRSLLPHQYYRVDEAFATPLLSVQITGFKCGGLAISVSISHRIFDLCSVATFITAWRNANNPAGGGEITPSLDGPSLFPAAKVNLGDIYISDTETFREFVVKRFVFNKEAIASLRSKLKPSSNGRAISRVRVVSALISKVLISLDRAKHGISRTHMITQVVDIRVRTIPALPKHSCGNLILPSASPPISADAGIQDLVDVISEAVEKTFHDCSKILLLPGADRGKIAHDLLADVVAEFKGGEVNIMRFSDFSKIGLRQVDFGWGKPFWARLAPFPSANMIVLMENKEDDGIEAWVHLNENDISYFEQDDDIRFFATT